MLNVEFFGTRIEKIKIDEKNLKKLIEIRLTSMSLRAQSRTNERLRYFDFAQSDRERIKIIVTSSEPVLSFVEMGTAEKGFIQIFPFF